MDTSLPEKETELGAFQKFFNKFGIPFVEGAVTNLFFKDARQFSKSYLNLKETTTFFHFDENGVFLGTEADETGSFFGKEVEWQL